MASGHRQGHRDSISRTFFAVPRGELRPSLLGRFVVHCSCELIVSGRARELLKLLRCQLVTVARPVARCGAAVTILLFVEIL